MMMIDKKEFPIAVATAGQSTIYICLKPTSSTYDGYVYDGEVSAPIQVYSLYLRLNGQGILPKSDEWNLIDETEFHKQFWEMETRSEKMPKEKWMAMFVTRSEPFSKTVLGSIGVKPEDLYSDNTRT